MIDKNQSWVIFIFIFIFTFILWLDSCSQAQQTEFHNAKPPVQAANKTRALRWE